MVTYSNDLFSGHPDAVRPESYEAALQVYRTALMDEEHGAFQFSTYCAIRGASGALYDAEDPRHAGIVDESRILATYILSFLNPAKRENFETAKAVAAAHYSFIDCVRAMYQTKGHRLPETPAPEDILSHQMGGEYMSLLAILEDSAKVFVNDLDGESYAQFRILLALHSEEGAGQYDQTVRQILIQFIVAIFVDASRLQRMVDDGDAAVAESILETESEIRRQTPAKPTKLKAKGSFELDEEFLRERTEQSRRMPP